MQTVIYEFNGARCFGIVYKDRIYNTREIANVLGIKSIPESLDAALAQDAELKQIQTLASAIPSLNIEAQNIDSVRLFSPLTMPKKVLGVAINYHDFCIRGNIPVPTALKIFTKCNNTINHHKGSIDIQGRNVTYEGELAVIIGRTCRNINLDSALHYVAGYTIVNDCTANDYVKEDIQLMRGKNLDGFLPMGPIFVSADEIPNPGRLHITTKVDGEIRQDSCTDQLIFSIPEIISFFASFMTLEPGDIIATGTPAGTALQFSPPKFLSPNQTVSITVEQIGTLINTVVSSQMCA